MRCNDDTSGADHVPVMLSESLHWLGVHAGGVYCDATLGAGGHAQALLEGSAPDGSLLGIDRDSEVLAVTKARLASFGERAVLVHATFDCIGDVARAHGIAQFDGILADLGVSSMQIDRADRGFSFMHEGPLDMRMDPTQGESAADLIATTGEEELANLIYTYGEERYSRRIARTIVSARSRADITTTAELARIVAGAVPGRHGRIHPATRTFQALRIAVNDELGMLERFLNAEAGLLPEGGRLVVISYHSLEDRIVKNAFRAYAAAGRGRVLTKKVLIPSDEEVARNPRARSAKMRVFEK